MKIWICCPVLIGSKQGELTPHSSPEDQVCCFQSPNVLCKVPDGALGWVNPVHRALLKSLLLRSGIAPKQESTM